MSFMPVVEPPQSRTLPRWLRAELRSDHAGELGAVAIYRGILATSRDEGVRQFAERHLQTEQEHLQTIESWLPAKERSLLLPAWRVAGFVTGALPALVGPAATYATIQAVETFVDHHYAQQIQRLTTEAIHPELCAVLAACREDEVAHRDEAAGLLDYTPGFLTRAWCKLVGWGSGAAVVLARLV